MFNNIINFTQPAAPFPFISTVNMDTPYCTVYLFVLDYCELAVTTNWTCVGDLPTECVFLKNFRTNFTKCVSTAAAEMRISAREMTYFANDVWTIWQRSHKMVVVAAIRAINYRLCPWRISCTSIINHRYYFSPWQSAYPGQLHAQLA